MFSFKTSLTEERGLIATFSYKVGDWRKDGTRVFLVVHNETARSNRHKVKQGDFDQTQVKNSLQVYLSTGTETK